MEDIKEAIIDSPLIPTEDQAAATVTGTALLVQTMRGPAQIVLDSAAMSTGDTLDLTIETGDLANGSDAAGITVYDTTGVDRASSAFTQVTDAAASRQKRYINLDEVKKYVRAVGTLAGSGILASFSVHLNSVQRNLP